MNGLIYLGAFTLAAIGFVVVVFSGTRGGSNEWPALGTNLGQAGSGMVWWRRRWVGWKNPSIPDAEEALGPHYDLRTVDHKLEQLSRHHGGHPHAAVRVHEHAAVSWMDEPGAMERDGLVDAPRTSGASPGDSSAVHAHPHQRKNPSVPGAEEALGPHHSLLTDDHQHEGLSRHHGAHQHATGSWMDDPGALERDGLVDAPPTSGARSGDSSGPAHGHPEDHRKH